MNIKQLVLLLFFLVFVVVTVAFVRNFTANGDVIHSENIFVTSPGVGNLVSSPLHVSGEARGTWYFEGEFDVRVADADMNTLGAHYVTHRVGTEWMTEQFVPFDGVIDFDPPTTATGYVIFTQSDPSGGEVEVESFFVPVRFE